MSIWAKIRNLFVSEVRVQRPEVLMNRKQRRAQASVMRKQAQRRKKRDPVS